jgi:NAD(P)-dependent dehydrogenase (short-subunit alcohol dehydrogenase family)
MWPRCWQSDHRSRNDLGVTSWTSADIPDQTGKTILVTGANSGLGFRSAQALARAGARVILACRNPTKAAEALTAVKNEATGAEPVSVSLDLADLASVSACVEEVGRFSEHLDVLMNNAGVMAIPRRETVDGFEAQFGTNHLGHFALTGRLLPLLLQAPAPRVVTTSSQAHRTGKMRWDDVQWRKRYRKWFAYGQSKLANLLFAFELDRRTRDKGTTLVSVAAHPGYAATHLQAVGPEMAGNNLMRRFTDIGNSLVAQSDTQGAWPQLYAATMGDVAGGTYYGPGGVFQMRGHPTLVRASRRARDAADAARLWTLSEQETSVTYPWP